MRNSVTTLLEQAKRKMSGYAALMNYRFQNLSVKAEPEALLSFTANISGEDVPMEKVANVRLAKGRDDQFEIFPLTNDLLMPIVKGLFQAHPEYKVEIPQVEDSEDPEDRFIQATMPDVDDNRHDLLMDAVSTLSDACDTQIEATFTLYTGKIATLLAQATPEELDEAKNALEDTHKQHKDLCKQFREQKENEIEDAYNEYLARKTAAQEQKAEEEAAHNEQAGLQMKWTPEDDE